MKKLMGLLAFGIGVGIGGSLGWYVWTHLPGEVVATLAGAGCTSASIIAVLAVSAVLNPIRSQQGKAPSPNAPLVG